MGEKNRKSIFFVIITILLVILIISVIVYIVKMNENLEAEKESVNTLESQVKNLEEKLNEVQSDDKETVESDKILVNNNLTQSQIEEKAINSAKELFKNDIFEYNKSYFLIEGFKYLSKEGKYHVVAFASTGQELQNLNSDSNSNLQKVYVDSNSFKIEKVFLNQQGEIIEMTLEKFLEHMTFTIVKDQYILTNKDYQNKFSDAAPILTIKSRNDRTSNTYDGIEIVEIKEGSYKNPDAATKLGEIKVNIKTRTLDINMY